jgi:hypothetical protein
MLCSCEDPTRATVFLDDSHSSCFLSLLALPFGLCNFLCRETQWVIEAEMVRDCEENMRAKGIGTWHHLNPCTHFNMMALLSVRISNLCSYVRRWLYILSRWGLSLHCHCKAPRSARSNSSLGSLRWVTHTYPIQGMPNNSITSVLQSPTHNWNIIGDKISLRQEMLMTLTFYLFTTFCLGYISIHSSTHQVTHNSSWRTSKIY